MPFGINLTGGKPKPLRLASHASVQELQPQQHQQQQQQAEMQFQQPLTPSEASAPTASVVVSVSQEFRLLYLGKQALSRPNSTGFGSVQKPLKEIYLNHLMTSKEGGDRQLERVVSFDGPDMVLRYRDVHTQLHQQESYPLDAVAYLDLVLFHTIKGKKRHFGYFRRHSDCTDVVPDSVLIPLHKKDHKPVTKAKHKPMLCLIVRRPYGIQFLECHVYQVESEQSGLDFIREFDTRSRARQQAEKRSQFSCQQQQQQQAWQQLNKWASQPMLLKPNAGASAPSDASETPMTPSSTGSSSRAVRAPTEPPQDALQTVPQPPRPAPRTSVAAAAAATAAAIQSAAASPHGPETDDDGPIRRSASGTIFDKYKELQVFNIPEYEYMGFQELQQIRIQQKRHHQRADGKDAASSGSNSAIGNCSNGNKSHVSHGSANNISGGDGGNGNLAKSGGGGFGGSSRIPVSVQSQRPPRPPTSGGSQLQRQTSAAAATGASNRSGEASRASTDREETPPRLPPRNAGGFGGGAKFPSDGNIKAKLQLAQQQQQPTASPEPQFGPRFNYSAGQQEAPPPPQSPSQRLPSAIPEESGSRRPGGVSGLVGRFELPPTPADVADPTKPVARVVPTARPLPGAPWQQQLLQQQKSVSRSNSAAVVQPHRVHHRSAGSRPGEASQQPQQLQQPQQQQRRMRPGGGGSSRVAGTSHLPAPAVNAAGSTPDFAAALGYLP